VQSRLKKEELTKQAGYVSSWEVVLDKTDFRSIGHLHAPASYCDNKSSPFRCKSGCLFCRKCNLGFSLESASSDFLSFQFAGERFVIRLGAFFGRLAPPGPEEMKGANIQ